MTFNRGSLLSVDYFASYLELVMNSRKCDSETAFHIALERIFQNNPDAFGMDTFENFQKAYEKISKQSHMTKF